MLSDVPSTQALKIIAAAEYTQDTGQTAQLIVNPANYSLTVNPSTIVGGSTDIATLTLTRSPSILNAASFGISVTRYGGVAVFPNFVSIAAGGSTGTVQSNNTGDPNHSENVASLRRRAICVFGERHDHHCSIQHYAR